MDVRHQLNIDFNSGLPTMPAPNSEGLPTKRPLGTDEMKQWLHMILVSKEISLEGRRLTSHSCKCTILSWLAKHGDDWADRMALGGHVSFMKSAIVYSRDAMARPIRVMEALLTKVRLGTFCPDETRSGRFREVAGAGADDSGSAEHSFGDSGWSLVDLPSESKSDTAQIVIDVDDDTNDVKVENPDSSSSDSDALTTSSSEDDEGAQFTGASRLMKLPTVPDSLKLLQHTKYKTLHLMEKQNNKIMLCGRATVQGRYDTADEARFDTPCCHQCWKRKKEYEP